MVNFAFMKQVKNVLFTLILSSIAFGGYSQEYNRVNAENKKVGKWRGFHPNGKLKYVGQFENGLPVDTFLIYYALGTLQTFLVYKTPTVAYATLYYDTGEKMASGKYVNKLKDSTWVTYGGNNVIIVEKGNYSMGKKVGKWKTFFDNGKVASEENYVNDIKEGEYVLYFETGEVKDKSTFKNGKLNGLSTLYDTDGDKFFEGIYVDGYKDKEWTYYDDNQKVDKVLIYEDGVLTNPDELDRILENTDKFKGNRKDALEFEDLRGTIKYNKEDE